MKGLGELIRRIEGYFDSYEVVSFKETETGTFLIEVKTNEESQEVENDNN